MLKSRDTTLKKILHVFLNEVLKDFQRFIIEKFDMPSSLWIFDEDNELQYIEPKESTQKYSKFCLCMISCKEDGRKYSECVEIEKSNIAEYLKKIPVGRVRDHCRIIECHMGISKMIFPIEVDRKIVGGLIFGQFRKDKLEDINIENKCNIFINNLKRKKISKLDLSKIESNIMKLFGLVPKESTICISEIIKRVNLLLPLLKRLYKYNYPQNHLFDGVVFLENIEELYKDVILCEEDLRERLGRSLKLIVDKLNLTSAVVFFSSTNNFQDLKLYASYPIEFSFPNSLQLQSSAEFQILANRRRGLILPTALTSLDWLNVQIVKLFFSNSAILYANRVFAGKMVIIAFGFKDKVFLNEFQRLLLRESTDRLFKHLNTNLSSIEIDHIMADTGHMLRRAIAAVEKGLANIAKHGLVIHESDSDPLKKIRTIAPKSIQYGLFRINLIVSNFHAFKTLREFQFGNDEAKKQKTKSILEEFDILEMIYDITGNYNHELKKHGKVFKINSKMNVLHYFGHKSLFRLMLLNIIDNASKFSYDRTYIDININKIAEHYNLSFSNLGVGVAKDEFDIVFNRYYQSRFRSDSKRREGSGYGLNICKKYLDIFLPKGSIRLTSRPARIIIRRNRKSKCFEGHNYLTTIDLRIPID